MLESSRVWVRTLGCLCVLGCMSSVACSDSEGNGVTGGSGGGGAGGTGNGGSSNGGSGNGGSSNGGSGNGGSGNGGTGGTSSDDAECQCGGITPCPETLVELCDDLPEGCPAELDIWLSCGARGEIGRQEEGEPSLVECGQYTIVVREANYIGRRRWVYDPQGTLVGVENVSDSSGPRCGLRLPQICRSIADGDPFVRPAVPDAGSDAGSIGDGGVADSGVADGGARAPECERL